MRHAITTTGVEERVAQGAFIDPKFKLDYAISSSRSASVWQLDVAKSPQGTQLSPTIRWPMGQQHSPLSSRGQSMKPLWLQPDLVVIIDSAELGLRSRFRV